MQQVFLKCVKEGEVKMKIAENLFDLNGKNAVVVGGAGGIGQAIAQGLAMYGANVVIAPVVKRSRRKSS